MRTAIVAIALLTASASDAGAEDYMPVCGDAMFEPSELALRDSGFDQSRSACVGNAFRTQARGTALIATEDFFGTVAASWFMSVRRVALRTIELEVGARVLDYRFAQNAIVTRTETSLGPIFAAVTQTFQTKWFGLPAAWAPSLRIDVPRTDTGYEITTFAATPALLATVAPSEQFRLHARLAALLFSASPPSGVDNQFAGALSFDSTYRPSWWFATSLGMEAQSGWHGQFDHLLLRGTVRFALGRNNRLDIAAAAPFLGEERTTLLFQLGFSRAM